MGTYGNMYNIGNWCNTIFPTMRWNQEPISAPRSQTQQCSLGYLPKFGRSILITPPRLPLKPTSGYTVWCLPPLPFFVGFILGFISFIPFRLQISASFKRYKSDTISSIGPRTIFCSCWSNSASRPSECWKQLAIYFHDATPGIANTSFYTPSFPF